jgi:hypothetical protein
MEMIAGVVQQGAKKAGGRESLRGLDGKKKEALSQFFRLLKNKFNKNTSRGFVGRGTHAVKFALNL